MQNFSCSALLRCHFGADVGFRLRASHPLRGTFPDPSPNVIRRLCQWSYNPGRCLDIAGLGFCAFARHYLRNHFCFLFLRVLRCFSSPGLLHTRYGDGIATAGLPHSEIYGSMDICSSPQLFAAYHVLLRLQEPRHPSCALFSFPFTFRLFSHTASVYSMRVNFQAAAPYRHCARFGCLDLLFTRVYPAYDSSAPYGASASLTGFRASIMSMSSLSYRSPWQS